MKTLPKKIRVVGTICVFLAVGTLARLILWPCPSTRRRFLIKNAGFFSRLCLRGLGVRVRLVGAERLARAGSHLVVSNHLSYLDALVLVGSLPCAFVTSREVESDLFLGSMCKAAGCLFVERRSRTALRDEVRELSGVLHQGFNLVIFPEGTTSNGEAVLPFKVSLLACAVEAQADVLPLCINYREIDGAPVTAATRDRIFYYGDMSFGPHFSGLFAVRSITVELEALDVIGVRGETSRKDVAAQAFSAIQRAYSAVPPAERG